MRSIVAWWGLLGLAGVAGLAGIAAHAAADPRPTPTPAAAAPSAPWAQKHRGSVEFEAYAVGNHSALLRVVLVTYPTAPKPGTRASKRPAPPPHKEKLAVLGADHQRSTRAVIPLPKTTVWSGIGQDDAVLVATKDGTLSRATDVDAAAAGAFTKIGRVAKATRWDANAATNIVIAGAGNVAYLSQDGGATFAAHKQPGRIEGVFVRADGVVVVDLVGAPPRVSRDDGATWATAPADLHRLRLERRGNWIGKPLAADGADGRGLPSCENGVLAKDGITWRGWTTQWEDEASKNDPKRKPEWGPVIDREESLLDQWDKKFYSWGGAFGTWPTALAEAALQPTHDADYRTLAADCEATASVGGLMGGGGYGTFNREGVAGCNGVNCLAMAGVDYLESRLEFDNVSDGECVSAASHKADHATESDACQGAVKRQPTIYVVDKAAKTFAMAPAPCGGDEYALHLGNGAGLAQCAATKEIQALDARGAWRSLGMVPFAVEHAAVAASGTVVLRDECYNKGAACSYVPIWPAARDAMALGPAVRDQYLRYAAPLANGNLVTVVAKPQPSDRTWIYVETDAGWSAADKALTKQQRPPYLVERYAKLADCFKALGEARVAGEVKVVWNGSKTTYRGTNADIERCASSVLGQFPPNVPAASNTLFFRQYMTVFDVTEVDATGAVVWRAPGLRITGQLTGINLAAGHALKVSETFNQPEYKRIEWEYDAALGALIPEQPAPTR